MGLVAALPASASDVPFTVANYPVDASAGNAVAAKAQAMADGQQAAFRSLLKRLVPVTAYGRLSRLKDVKPADLINGVSVRSESTSSTEYIATLDFSFQPQAVRDLLRRESIPFIDVQAPETVVVAAYEAQAAGAAADSGARAWVEAWKGLDLQHTLTPVRLDPPRSSVPADIWKALKQGNASGLRSLQSAHKADRIVVAMAEADTAGGKLNVTLIGEDVVGPFSLKRSYRMTGDEFAYTAELAAVVALGILEGRWKAYQVASTRGGVDTLASGPEPVQLLVEYRNLQEWQDMRRQIAATPGVEDLQVGGVSARAADVALRYPGGGSQLAAALGRLGLRVDNAGGTWVVRP
jgi:hypothetical protein